MDSVNLRETLLLEKKWTKGRRRYFELQSSELGGNKKNLRAQLEFQLVGVETKSVPFSFSQSCKKDQKSRL